MPGPIASCCILAALALLPAGCEPPSRRTRTFVTGRIEPRHIQFVDLVKQSSTEPGGWRAACIHFNIQRRNTGESFLCKFGLEMPLQNEDMPISTPLAQRIAAERAHAAARLVFGSASATSPLGMLCETFKATLRTQLQAAVSGSRLTTTCHEKTQPVQFGRFTP